MFDPTCSQLTENRDSLPKPQTASMASAAIRAYRSTSESLISEDAMVKANLPLVRAVVERIKATLPSHIEADDLYSVGLAGLVHAVRKFNPLHGTTFAGFATTRIRGAVLDELRRMDWMSRSGRNKAKQLTETIAQLEQRLGRPALEDEVAAELEMTPADYASLLEEVKPVCHLELDETIAEGEDASTLHDVIADSSQTTASEQLQKKELIGLVVARLERLPEMQRKVLAMYYFENLRLAEIAQAFGVTESRICQIHSQAVLSLRTYTKAAMSR